jgi:hypothetical protein
MLSISLINLDHLVLHLSSDFGDTVGAGSSSAFVHLRRYIRNYLLRPHGGPQCSPLAQIVPCVKLLP